MDRKKLLARQSELSAEGQRIIEAASEANGFTDESRARLKDISAELSQIDGDLELVNAQRARLRQMERLELPTNGTGEPNAETVEALTFGEYLGGVADVYTSGRTPSERWQAAATGQGQQVPADGGFLVDPSHSSTVWDGLNTRPDSLLAMTDDYTVTGESLTFKANAETSRATGSRFGGIQGYWIAEAAAITGSKVKFRDLRLEPKELAVLVYVTEKLLRNATALEQYVARAAEDEINFLVGDAIINGSGAGKPQGIMNCGSLVTVNKEAGQGAATFLAENVSKMWARLHPTSKARAVWLINGEVEPQLDELSFATGTSGQLMYLQAGGLTGTAPARLKGRPIMETEYNAALGTLGDVILADMQAYATGIAGTGIRAANSMHVKFTQAEMAFRFMFSVDGQGWQNVALTPFKGSATRSSFVTLQARS